MFSRFQTDIEIETEPSYDGYRAFLDDLRFI